MTYKLLIVDDEPANIRLLEKLFRADYSCLTASSGEEAIELLDQHEVAVIITDPLLIARGAHDAAITGDTAGTLFGPTFAHVVLLTVATILSVFKPKGLTPYGRRVQGQ